LCKGGSAAFSIEHLGRRGKPVNRLSYLPSEKADALARRLQGMPCCTVAVC
jgi:hypothetical protein